MKERITITIDKGLLKWLDENVASKVFANRSHGLEFLVVQEAKEESNEEKNI
jgi:metal-responsive CopG/Arc/MetJ family transcriptional regulator